MGIGFLIRLPMGRRLATLSVGTISIWPPVMYFSTGHSHGRMRLPSAIAAKAYGQRRLTLLLARRIAHLETGGREYLRTFAAVEAKYESIDEWRCVSLPEVLHPNSENLVESVSVAGETVEQANKNSKLGWRGQGESSDPGSERYRA